VGCEQDPWIKIIEEWLTVLIHKLYWMK
jgi:hypothetical protein